MSKIRDIFKHPLVLMVLLVIILNIYINLANIPDGGSTFDRTLFYVVAGISGLVALFILVRTKWRDWTVLGSGLLGHFIAVGLVYFVTVYYSTNAYDPYTHELIVLARAGLIVSGVFVLYGIVTEWFADIGCDAGCVWNRVKSPLRSFKDWFSKHKR